MAQNRRWLIAASKEAAKGDFRMPWVRGERRKAFIAKRSSLQAIARRRANA